MKEEDSELRFVENELHTISVGQTTHEDSLHKIGLRRILFDKSCLQRILSHQKIWPEEHFFDTKSSS
jgi:hypothetical protein